MLEILLLVFITGVLTGFFDSVIGAGGLISVPALIFLGLPPQTAIATDRFGLLGQSPPALYKFWKAKKIVWKYVPAFSVISLIASLIGANILLTVDPGVLEPIIGITILILLPLVFLKRNIGLKKIRTTRTKNIIGLTLYFLIMVFGGFFGQGTGPMVFYSLAFFLGFTMLEVTGTGIIPWFILTISSLAIFALNGIIDYKIGIMLLIGMSIGSYIGAHFVIKKGEKWLKSLFVVFVLVLGLKLILF